jgi:hypothetical protein
MTTVVRVQVHNLDPDDEATFDALATFDNATFSKVDDLAYMTVFVEDDQDVVSTVIEAARKLTYKVSGAHVERVDPDLVSATDIAKRVGVSREAVRKWVHSTKRAFPEHLGTIGDGQRVWRWGDIVRWLWDTKRIDMDENLPTAADVDHIDACLKRVPDITTQAWDEVQVIEPRYKETIRSARRPTKQPLVEFVWPDGGDRVIVVAAGRQARGTSHEREQIRVG